MIINKYFAVKNFMYSFAQIGKLEFLEWYILIH